MTSTDGINWTGQTASAVSNWTSVTYGNGLFVAVASLGTTRVMTSPDGINWTNRTAAEANSWSSVSYGNGVFVAAATSGTNRIMTSRDGINWTAQTTPTSTIFLSSVTFGADRFVSVGAFGSGLQQVMSAPCYE